MDEQEELRSLYSVICPRCQSVSQAGDIACPYCGADRHGAVLTRADEPLAPHEEFVQAELPASFTVGSVSVPATKRNRTAVFAVVLGVVAVSYGLVRAPSHESAQISAVDQVSATGAVRSAASVNRAALSGNDRAMQTDTSLRVVAFGVPVRSPLPPCEVEGAAAFGLRMFWCDALSLGRPVLPLGMNTPDNAAAAALTSARKDVESSGTTKSRPSTKSERNESRIYASAKEKESGKRLAGSRKTMACGHKKSEACNAKSPVRAYAAGEKRQRAPHVASSARKRENVESFRGSSIGANASNPAMTSAGSWTPPTNAEPIMATGQAESGASSQGVKAPRGRGEAH